MYIIKNAWTNIVRGKGRNILIGIILTVVTTSACIALSIKKSGDNLVENYKNSNPIEVTFSLDMMSIRQDRSSDETITVDKLDTTSIAKYGDSKYVKDYYYTLQSSLSSDEVDPISTDEVYSDTDDTKTEDTNKPTGGPENKMSSGDFKITAYSDVSYIEKFIDGTNKITKGKMFTNDNTDAVIVISEDLAQENDLEVGDKVTLYNPNDEDTTYEFTVYGIYADTSTNDENFMNMTAMNSQNQIYTNLTSLNKILDDSDDANSVSAKFYLNSSDDITAFEKEVRSEGLSDYYTVGSNLDNILETLSPIQNISNFSMTFLIIILIVGGFVMGIINMINIRERKYEIGVLRAIGMNKLKVCIQLITEIFVVAIISLIIGTCIGYAVSQPVTNQMLKSEISNYEEDETTVQDNFGGPGFDRKGFSDSKNTNVEYVDTLKVDVDFITILELFGVSILLTVVSGAISVIFINKYEPNKILQNRA